MHVLNGLRVVRPFTAEAQYEALQAGESHYDNEDVAAKMGDHKPYYTRGDRSTRGRRTGPRGRRSPGQSSRIEEGGAGTGVGVGEILPAPKSGGEGRSVSEVASSLFPGGSTSSGISGISGISGRSSASSGISGGEVGLDQDVLTGLRSQMLLSAHRSEDSCSDEEDEEIIFSSSGPPSVSPTPPAVATSSQRKSSKSARTEAGETAVGEEEGAGGRGGGTRNRSGGRNVTGSRVGDDEYEEPPWGAGVGTGKGEKSAGTQEGRGKPPDGRWRNDKKSVQWVQVMPQTLPKSTRTPVWRTEEDGGDGRDGGDGGGRRGESQGRHNLKDPPSQGNNPFKHAPSNRSSPSPMGSMDVDNSSVPAARESRRRGRDLAGAVKTGINSAMHVMDRHFASSTAVRDFNEAMPVLNIPTNFEAKRGQVIRSDPNERLREMDNWGDEEDIE